MNKFTMDQRCDNETQRCDWQSALKEKYEAIMNQPCTPNPRGHLDILWPEPRYYVKDGKRVEWIFDVPKMVLSANAKRVEWDSPSFYVPIVLVADCPKRKAEEERHRVWTSKQ